MVGLDTMAHVIKTLQDNLNAETDPFFASFATPPVLAKLIEHGRARPEDRRRLLQEGRQGHPALRPGEGRLRAGGGKADEIVARMLKKPPAERLKLLRESKNPQAQFLWAILRDSFHYAAVHLGRRSPRARATSTSRCAGASACSRARSSCGRQAGWKQVAQWIKEDIDAGKALSQARRCRRGCSRARWPSDGGVHTPEGSWSAAQARFVPPQHAAGLRSASRSARACSAPTRRTPLKAGTEVFKNDEVRVWTLDGEVLIASITAKLHLISPAVTEGLLKAVELAEAKYKGLVIWSPDDVFSAGANLEALMPVFMKSGGKGIAPEEKKLQDAMLRMRYAQRAGGRGDARHGAGRRLRAGGALRRGASRRWKATSAWSRSASA